MNRTHMAGTLSAFLCVTALAAAPAAYATDAPAPAGLGADSGQLAATYAGFGSGMNDAVATVDKQLKAAVQYKLDVGGKKVTAYCVQFGVDVNKTSPYASTGWAASHVANMGKVADIVAHHSTLGTPLEDPRYEAAAVQAAVWAETGDIKLDALQVPDATYRDRAAALVAAATDMAEPASAITLAADSTAGDAAHGATVNVDVSGNTGPQAGVPVKVSSPSGVVDGVTADDGKAALTLPGAGGVAADVSATVTFGPGVLVDPGQGQMMVLAESVTVDRTTSVAVAAVPPAPLTPAPTPSGATPTPDLSLAAATPTPTPTEATPTPAPSTPEATATPTAATELPNTGSSDAPWMVGAALLAAAAGGSVFAWSRLRPSRHN